MKIRLSAKRFTAACLAFLTVFAFAFPANSTEATCELKLSDGEGYAGTRANITLSVRNNSGISNGILFVRYDPELLSIEAEDISVGEVGAKFEIIETKQQQGVVTLGFVNLANVTEDGILFILPFTVALDAYPTETKIDIEVKELVGSDNEPAQVTSLGSEFIISEPPPCKLGDIDNDGEVDIVDAMLVLYHVAEKELLPNEKLVAANINKDKTVDITDAMRILYFVAKKTAEL